MRRDSWRSILAARADVDRMVAASFGDHPRQGPVEPAGESSSEPFRAPQWQDPGASESAPAGASEGAGASGGTRLSLGRSAELERAGLQSLHERVEQRLEQLRQQLQHEHGRDQAMLALVFYFDERIMARLPEYLRLAWPLLQTKRTGQRTGGDDFYTSVEQLRRDPTTPSFVFEVYYFCLSNGFIGRYAKDLASIERYKQWLQESITLQEVPTEASDTAELSTQSRKPVAGWVSYLVSLVVVVLLTVLLTLLSNY